MKKKEVKKTKKNYNYVQQRKLVRGGPIQAHRHSTALLSEYIREIGIKLFQTKKKRKEFEEKIII